MACPHILYGLPQGHQELVESFMGAGRPRVTALSPVIDDGSARSETAAGPADAAVGRIEWGVVSGRGLPLMWMTMSPASPLALDGVYSLAATQLPEYDG